MVKCDFLVSFKISLYFLTLAVAAGEEKAFSNFSHDSYYRVLVGLSTFNWPFPSSLLIILEFSGKAVLRIRNIFFHFSSESSMSPISSILIIFLTVCTVRLY